LYGRTEDEKDEVNGKLTTEVAQEETPFLIVKYCVGIAIAELFREIIELTKEK